MEPISFKEQNVVFAKDQSEYLPLPAHFGNNIVTTCWKFTFWERIKILFTGQMWFQQMTFGNPLQPQRPCVEKPELT